MDEELAWSREARWPAQPHHVGEARSFVVDCLAETDLMRVSHTVALVVSELATNAVLHAKTPFTVTVARRGDWLVVEVRDYVACRVAVPDASDEMELTGRGPEIVRAVSEAWGVWQRRDGKPVWAAFDLHPRPQASAADRTSSADAQ